MAKVPILLVNVLTHSRSCDHTVYGSDQVVGVHACMCVVLGVRCGGEGMDVLRPGHRSGRETVVGSKINSISTAVLN